MVKKISEGLLLAVLGVGLAWLGINFFVALIMVNNIDQCKTYDTSANAYLLPLPAGICTAINTIRQDSEETTCQGSTCPM